MTERFGGNAVLGSDLFAISFENEHIVECFCIFFAQFRGYDAEHCFKGLRIPLPARRRNIELDWKDYDDLGYLSGHSVGEAEGAMFDALVQTHASLDIPLIILSAGQLDAPQLGELFYFLELTAALCAAADGLNPFDRKRSSPTRAQAAALLRG